MYICNVKTNKGMKAIELIEKLGFSDSKMYGELLPDKDVERVKEYCFNNFLPTPGRYLSFVYPTGFQKEFKLKIAGNKIQGTMDRRINDAVLINCWDSNGNPMSLEDCQKADTVEFGMDFPSNDAMMTYKQERYLSSLAEQGHIEGWDFDSSYRAQKSISKALASVLIDYIKNGKKIILK